MTWTKEKEEEIVRHYNAGMTHREIAQIMGITESKSKDKIYKLKKRGEKTIVRHSEGQLDRQTQCTAAEEIDIVRTAYLKRRELLLSQGEDVGPFVGNADLAKELGLNRTVIDNMVKRYKWYEEIEDSMESAKAPNSMGEPLTARGRSIIRLDEKEREQQKSLVHEILEPLKQYGTEIVLIKEALNEIAGEVDSKRHDIHIERLKLFETRPTSVGSIKSQALESSKRIRVLQRDLDILTNTNQLLMEKMEATAGYAREARIDIYEEQIKASADAISQMESQIARIAKHAEDIAGNSKGVLKWATRQVDRLRGLCNA